MRSSDESRRFPSGRTLADCRKDAKRLVRSEGIPLAQAQQRVAAANGAPQGWARALAGLAAAAIVRRHGPALMMDIDAVRAVLDKEPMLTRFGFGASLSSARAAGGYGAALARGRQELLDHWEECNRAARFLLHVERRKTINPTMDGGSYSLKHIAQFYMGRVADNRPADPYISNGALICAALHAGFDMRPDPDGGPNVRFNVSSRSPVLAWRRIAELPTYRHPSLAARKQRLSERVGVGGH